MPVQTVRARELKKVHQDPFVKARTNGWAHGVHAYRLRQGRPFAVQSLNQDMLTDRIPSL